MSVLIFDRSGMWQWDGKHPIFRLDTEFVNKRPKCQKEDCGSEHSLKQVIYDDGSKRVACPKHLRDFWGPGASSAEPLEEAKRTT